MSPFLKRDILECVKDGAKDPKEIVEALTRTEKDVRGAIVELVDNGELGVTMDWKVQRYIRDMAGKKTKPRKGRARSR